MVRSPLLCFRPFSFAECSLSTQDACAFYSSLLEDLKRLEQSLGEGSVSLRWSVEAMNLLKRMQLELLILIRKCKVPIFIGDQEDWFHQYMQETAALLDFCNSLKSAIAGINRYRMVIDHTVQKLVQGTCMISLEELELQKAEQEQGQFLGARLAKGTVSIGREVGFSKTDKSIASVMLAAKCTMMVVSMLLVSAIVCPLSIDMRNEKLTSAYPQLKPFMEMLGALVHRFYERVLRQRNGGRLALAEHEMVDSVVGELKARVGDGEREKILMSAELLRTSSDELREGIDMFDSVVDEVFDVVIKGREEMLGVFRNYALSMG